MTEKHNYKIWGNFAVENDTVIEGMDQEVVERYYITMPNGSVLYCSLHKGIELGPSCAANDTMYTINTTLVYWKDPSGDHAILIQNGGSYF